MCSFNILDVNIQNNKEKQQTIPPFISKITTNISYSDFFNEYILANIPCIVKDVTYGWKSNSQWVTDDLPNFQNLISKYGVTMVPITDCNKPDQATKYMPLKEYVEYVETLTPEKSKTSLLYLKDWHLRRENPDDDFYCVPKYFASDWLNEYSVDTKRDDHMFVYFGPKGSWTPFHVDVFTSFSWSANVVGQKKWILLPPGEEFKFLDDMGNVPKNIENLLDESHTYFEVIQNAGEAIFVPSGWYHQVWNLEHTISINHNWINGCNIERMFKVLKRNMEMVESEIIEYKGAEGWEEHCQVMLRSLFGMNYEDFCDFVIHITEKRIYSLKNGNDLAFANWNLSNSHIIFDLQSMKLVLENLVVEPYVDEFKVSEIKELINDISCISNKIY